MVTTLTSLKMRTSPHVVRLQAEPVEFGEILEVEADLNELEELLSHAKRAQTRSLLETEAARLKV